MTGGVVQTREGWTWAPRLQHGREAVRSDERVLGQPAFLEALLRQVDDMQASTGRHRTVTLDRLIAVVCPDQQVTREAIRGTGRLPAVCRAREGLAYLWIEYLGRSGRQLAQAVGIRPESIYKGGAPQGTRARAMAAAASPHLTKPLMPQRPPSPPHRLLPKISWPIKSQIKLIEIRHPHQISGKCLTSIQDIKF